MKRTKILVTGASGFVGSALVHHLAKSSKYDTVAAMRSSNITFPSGVITCEVESLSGTADYSSALKGVHVVVHAAARVHVLNDRADNPLEVYRSINVEGTLNLARQAATSNVRRFIFLSSIKVNGEVSSYDRPFTSEDVPNPLDYYGISKYEAEVGLSRIAKSTGMEVVIVRPPLVYGPGVKANFFKMMSWLDRGIPLPLGAVFNKRSFISIANLVDLLQVCIEHPKAANEIFLASDGQDLSTTELLRHIASALGKPVRLIPVPTSLMRVAAILLHRHEISVRLFDCLQVDIGKTKQVLGWNPPVGIDEALVSTAQYFLSEKGS